MFQIEQKIGTWTNWNLHQIDGQKMDKWGYMAILIGKIREDDDNWSYTLIQIVTGGFWGTLFSDQYVVGYGVKYHPSRSVHEYSED